ncbi:MAG: tRNA (adenosine(37)-N6)-threonylcarbamoyltransferase complex dimerization subunit type 1 TsaB [Gammaproteobacteria bacterium]|nr:tRNA (adenosine(37)-N6)-threonylcarbamoyltransferase complex dimerization subunit type 1 TsaB [Gammaproteobacteria bacterium]
MKLLAFETSTEACSAALFVDGVKTSVFEHCPQQQAQRILPMIDQLLVAAKIKASELDVIAFGAGPGSFTGIRIAVGVAQGIACAFNIPLLPISTLKIMAETAYLQNTAQYSARHSISLLTALDARMQEIYWAGWQWQENDWVAVINETVALPEQVVLPNAQSGAWLAVGNAWSIYPSLTLRANSLVSMISVDTQTLWPQAEALLNLALADFAAGKALPVQAALPTYLRNNVASPPKAL